MLEIRGRTFRLCDGQTRRGFIKIGSLGLAGLTLPNLLALRHSQGAAKCVSAAAKNAAHDRAVILFWMAGGPSHIDMYHMKPKQPAEVRGPFSPIATNLSGFDVCDLLPRHAKIADKLAVIRSFTHEYGVHDDAQHLVQTGYPNLNARQNGQRQAFSGAVGTAGPAAGGSGRDVRHHQFL